MSDQPGGTVTDDIGRSGAIAALEGAHPLDTLHLDPTHRVGDFSCSKSERVTRFLREQAQDWMERRYCGVFIFPNPADPAVVWGYYTLSQFVVARDDMRNKDKNRQLLQTVPLAQIGFMGKADGTPTGLGAILLTDAARRVYRSLDIPAWGITLEPERGKDNPKLWAWYQRAGFIELKSNPNRMYASYEKLIPELGNAVS
ncbi:MAG: hypothetical protein WBB34_20415 [Xanthobacteraceae bacterium]